MKSGRGSASPSQRLPSAPSLSSRCGSWTRTTRGCGSCTRRSRSSAATAVPAPATSLSPRKNAPARRQKRQRCAGCWRSWGQCSSTAAPSTSTETASRSGWRRATPTASQGWKRCTSCTRWTSRWRASRALRQGPRSSLSRTPASALERCTPGRGSRPGAWIGSQSTCSRPRTKSKTMARASTAVRSEQRGRDEERGGGGGRRE
mmetsp:Transcript_58695/g.138331  ORF Transcript_58695/g.138331 Transcript_58695/m.138331 type:complete len:204 (+) Transcript_58695:1137-1748(+)